MLTNPIPFDDALQLYPYPALSMPLKSPLKILWHNCSNYGSSAPEWTRGAFPLMALTKLEKKIAQILGRSDKENTIPIKTTKGTTKAISD